MKKIRGRNAALALFLALIWYPGGDSNSHTLRHTHLKRTCIPFQHLGLSASKLFERGASIVLCSYTLRQQPEQTQEIKKEPKRLVSIAKV